MDKNTQKVLFSSANEEWETPIKLYKELNDKFNFTLDAAANHFNYKCQNYYTKEDNALSKDWSGNVVFCNPPYGRNLKKWVKKFYEEGLKENTVVVVLIPARTDTIAFHEYCLKAKEIYFIKGRIVFTELGVEKHPAPFPSMIVVFDGEVINGPIFKDYIYNRK